MPYPAPGPAYDFETPSDAAEHHCAVRVVRTLLAGAFAGPSTNTRPAIEAMFAEPESGLAYRLLPEGHDVVATLARDGGDLVLIDLAGPIGTVLALVARLRAAAASGSVVFVGIMPCDASPAARLYLPAVLDAVMQGPLRAAGLAWAITDAMHSTPSAAACSLEASTPARATRH